MHILEKALNVIGNSGVERVDMNKFFVTNLSGETFTVNIGLNDRGWWTCTCKWGQAGNKSECYHALAVKLLLRTSRIQRTPQIKNYFDLLKLRVNEVAIYRQRKAIALPPFPVVEHEE